MKESENRPKPEGYIRVFDKETGQLVYQTLEADTGLLELFRQEMGFDKAEELREGLEGFFHGQFPGCNVVIK